MNYALGERSPVEASKERLKPDREVMASLRQLDWNFADAKTNYLTHGLHPYPAKFIPQIPNALIQELSSVGETVGDIFCGSGTTLVEALMLKRHAVGVDANPLACLISRAKTSRLQEGDCKRLSALVGRARQFAEMVSGVGTSTLFPSQIFRSTAPRPNDESISSWFEPFIVEELAEMLSWCRELGTNSSKEIALTAFSSIVVGVSKQDSDTRYVRREKNLGAGDAFSRFAAVLSKATTAAVEFTELTEPRFRSEVLHRSVLAAPDIPVMDLMVGSPPYPNAWSYHLYHRTRMVWLGMDQPRFKVEEIGSHRKYSRKVPREQKVATFRNELDAIFGWLRRHLRRGRYACFVVGDSIVDGRVMRNADMIVEAATQEGFSESARIARTIRATKKAFNPKIGKIKEEEILILRNHQGVSP